MSFWAPLIMVPTFIARPFKLGRLSGRVALITGAARGIGFAICSRFVAEGAFVAVADLNGDEAFRAAQRLGARAIGLPMDVTQPVSIAKALERMSKDLAPPDLLVNNAAAITQKGNVVDLDIGAWNAAIAVNLTGAFLVSRSVIPLMRSGGGGVIVNIASTLASVAVKEAPAYCASKGGLLQLTRAMALDHAKDGIRVNAISPGPVRTERLGNLYGSQEVAEHKLSHSNPSRRIATTDEIALAGVYLASDEASYTTGINLLVDGGASAQ